MGDMHGLTESLDEWEHFLYVGKVAFFGWALHYGTLPPFGFVATNRFVQLHSSLWDVLHTSTTMSVMPRSSSSLFLTFCDQLPTLYFAVIMLAHMLDHFIFSSRRLVMKTKAIAFGVCAGSIILCFWWFKGVAFGIDGPIDEHKGLLWRKVSLSVHSIGNANDCSVVEYIHIGGACCQRAFSNILFVLIHIY